MDTTSETQGAETQPQPYDYEAEYAKLSPKRRRFVDEYLTDCCATKAAVRAGYSQKSAESQGIQLYGKLRGVIEGKLKARQIKLGVTQDYVLGEILSIVRANPLKYLKIDNGRLYLREDFNEIPEELAACIHEIKEVPVKGQKPAIQFKLYSRLTALELLGRHLAMWTDKMRVGGDPDNPEPIRHKVVSEILDAINGATRGLPVASVAVQPGEGGAGDGAGKKDGQLCS